MGEELFLRAAESRSQKGCNSTLGERRSWKGEIHRALERDRI
jgi:hypothetical protein